MAKVVLPPITGSNNIQRMNDNFQIIANALNEEVLYRDNPVGEPNEMLNDLDMNNQRIYNLPAPVLDHEPARWVDVKGLSDAVEDSLANALRAEAAADAADAFSENAEAAAAEAEASAVDAQASEDATEGLWFDFNKRYLGAHATDPTTDLNGDPLVAGALYYNTTLQGMREYNGTTWVEFSSAASATIGRPPGAIPFISAQGQNVFPVAGGYVSTQIIVYLNGVQINGGEINLTSGTNIVFNTPLNAGDLVDYYAFSAFEVADAYTKAETDALIAGVNGSINAVSADLAASFGKPSQTMQNLTASRLASTRYTNNTGRPILVYAQYTATAAGTGIVGSIAPDMVSPLMPVSNNWLTTTAAGQITATHFTVPPGWVYAVSGSLGAAPLTSWYEYR